MARQPYPESSPPGSDKPALPREFIEDHRRQRIVQAVAEAAHEEGIHAITVRNLCARSKMGRGTFYDLFGGTSDCLRFAFSQAFAKVFGSLQPAAIDGPWLQRMRGSVDRFFISVGAEPLLAELCLVRSPEAGELADLHDAEAGIGLITAQMDGGRAAARAALGEEYRDPPALAEEFLARAIVTLAATEIRLHGTVRAGDLADEMTLLAATTFYGPDRTGWVSKDLEMAGLGSPKRERRDSSRPPRPE